jgi:hypothetical protein
VEEDQGAGVGQPLTEADTGKFLAKGNLRPTANVQFYEWESKYQFPLAII